MFLDSRFRTVRALSVTATTTMVAVTALVASAPATGAEIYPRPANSIITLAGHGYGHGHGMSQYGAEGAAQRGNSWQDIVAFYYPGTTRTAVGNPTLRVSVAGVLGDRAVVLPAAGLQATFGAARSSTIALPVASFGQPILYWYVARNGAATELRFKRQDNQTFTYPATTDTQVNLENTVTDKVVAQVASGALITYPGTLSGVAVGTATVKPVLSLPMETYLRTVVPSEMPSSWTTAALSAQAVAARSYAYYGLKHPSTTYDICDTTACQVFNGTSRLLGGKTTTYEYAASNAAIAASAGTVLTYQGEVAFTQFSSSNGGWTSKGAQAYLVAKADPFDGIAANANHSWSASISASTIEAAWPSIGTYRALQVTSRDGNGEWGGRVVTAAVVGSAGTVSVTGPALRAALGLRSEWFVPTILRSAPSYPRDFSGDHRADVLAVVAPTGTLGLYAGNGRSGWVPMKVVGKSFGGSLNPFTIGTWTADGLSDVMAVKSDGSLWLYPGQAGGPLALGHKIATGFAHNYVFPVGDFNGDGFTDLLARRPDGRLVLYPSNGHGAFLGYRTVGGGWGSFTALFSPGDFTGDGKSDVIARDPGGVLYVYPGDGAGGWLPRRTIGQGWSGFTALTSAGDLNGDGRTDLLARRWDGKLWMYPGNGAGGFLPARAVGAGWNVFSSILR